jgi:hypothetical protein
MMMLVTPRCTCSKGLACAESASLKAPKTRESTWIFGGGPKGIWHTDVLSRRMTNLTFEGLALAL